MKNLCAHTFAFVFGILSCHVALAQPTLERVEEGVRRQVGPAGDRAPALAPAAEPGYLGVIADEANVRGSGVLVREVLPDGPAARGGLQTNDRITAINGRVVAKLSDMQVALKDLPVGTKLNFQIDRGGNVATKEVTLAVRPAQSERPFQTFGYIPQGNPGPAQTGPPPGGPRLGIRTLPLAETDRQRLGVPATSGARIVAVTSEGPAEQAGIPVDAVITAVDDRPVQGPDELGQYIRAQAPGKQVQLTYYIGSQEMRSRVILGGSEGRSAAPAPQVGLPAFSADQRPTMAGPSPEERIEQLERRVRELESRLAKLEAQSVPQPK